MYVGGAKQAQVLLQDPPRPQGMEFTSFHSKGML